MLTYDVAIWSLKSLLSVPNLAHGGSNSGLPILNLHGYEPYRALCSNS